MFRFLLVSFALFSVQEPNVLQNIQQAIEIGNARELVKYCNETIGIKIDDKSASYSKKKSEIILRLFFQKHPVRGFSYIHKGSSPEGLKYSIGRYLYDEGSYRVVMYLKKTKGKYQIDTLNFSKE